MHSGAASLALSLSAAVAHVGKRVMRGPARMCAGHARMCATSGDCSRPAGPSSRLEQLPAAASAHAGQQQHGATSTAIARVRPLLCWACAHAHSGSRIVKAAQLCWSLARR